MLVFDPSKLHYDHWNQGGIGIFVHDKGDLGEQGKHDTLKNDLKLQTVGKDSFLLGTGLLIHVCMASVDES